MNWVDIVVGLFMVLFLVAGLRRGFIREVTGFVGLVLAFVLGIAGSPIWSKAIVNLLHFPPSVATVVSFILIFILVFLLCKAAGNLLFKIVRQTPLHLLDRLGGSVIGLLKGGLLISLLLLFLGLFSLPQTIAKPLDSSVLVPTMRVFAPGVYNFLKGAFPQMRSLGEVIGQSVERGFARGKEQVLEKGSQLVDQLQKAKAAQKDGEDRRDHTEADEKSAEGR